jgi:hypothetical protein
MNKITNLKLQIPNKLQIQMFKITNWIPAGVYLRVPSGAGTTKRELGMTLFFNQNLIFLVFLLQ